MHISSYKNINDISLWGKQTNKMHPCLLFTFTTNPQKGLLFCKEDPLVIWIDNTNNSSLQNVFIKKKQKKSLISRKYISLENYSGGFGAPIGPSSN